MPFDAQRLWWPPLKRLYGLLAQSPAEQGGRPIAAGKFGDYQAVLLKGIAFFAGPNADSRRAVEAEKSVKVGNKTLPIDPALRKPTFELSRLLDLDEMQTYLLLRRWLSMGSEVIAAEALTQEQRASLQAFYFIERNYILRCYHYLLHCDPSDDGPTSISSLTQKLLEGRLEDTICDALVTNVSAQQTDQDAAGGRELQLSDMSVDQEGAVSKAEQDQQEQLALLDLAVLLYTRQGRSCSLQRGLQMLRVLKPLLTSGPGTQPGSALERQQPDHLAFILMLSLLDTGKLMQIVKEDGTLDAEAHRLGSTSARAEVNGELHSWGPPKLSANGQITMHAPLLLGWGTFLCLANSLASPAEAELSWQHHADLAWKSGALQALAGIMHAGTLASGMQMGLLYRAVLNDLLLAFLGCFSLSPSGLPANSLDALLALVEGIYQGNEQLCALLWKNEGSAVPLRRFLDDARDLFPAVPEPLLRLLSALASGKAAATAAAEYLDQIPRLAGTYSLGDRALRQLPVGEGLVEACQPLTIQSTGLCIPQGAQGRLASLPVAAKKGGSVGSEAIESSIIVQWDVCLPKGQYLLLGYIRISIGLLHQASAYGRRPSKANTKAVEAQVGLALRLLAVLSVAQPAAALRAAQLEIAGPSEITLPTLIAQAVDVLSQLPDPPLAAIGDCLLIASSLALSMAPRAADELSTSSLLQPSSASASFGSTATAGLAKTRLLKLLHLGTTAEARSGTYPVTLAVLDLACTLLRAGSSHPIIQGLVGFALTHVLAKHHQWCYAQRSERWRIAAAALRVLDAALTVRPAAGGTGVAAGLRSWLAHKGAGEAYIFGALPPIAMVLESLEAAGSTAEVGATEAAVLEWLHLVPNLLAEDGPEAAQLAQSFFEVPDDRSLSAATILASYIAYSSFNAEERALAFQALAALAQATATLPHICFAACLPHRLGGGSKIVVRQPLLEPFLNPTRVPLSLFKASCQLLLAALSSHPTLQDILLFPSGLSDYHNQNRTEHDAPAGAGRKRESSQTMPSPQASKNAGNSSEEVSALDGLWGILTLPRDDLVQHPAVVAMALQCLLALWQGGAMTYRAVQLLRTQPGFWEAVGACVPEGLQRQLILDNDEDTVQDWTARADAAWLFAGEASALQLIALEAYRYPRPASGCGTDKGVWALLDKWEADEGGGRLLGLMQRYSGASTGDSLVRRLAQDAKLAALELVSSLICSESLGDSLCRPGTLLALLHAAARPLLTPFSSPQNAAAGITALAQNVANQVELPPGTLQEHLLAVLRQQDIGGVLLAASAVSKESTLGTPNYGAGFLYDTSILQHQIGPVFVQHLAPLQSLISTMRAVSVMASLEEGRLLALRSLKAAYTVAQPEARLPAPSSSPLEPLSSTLRPLLDTSNTPEASTSDAFSCSNATLTFSVEVAQVALVQLRRLHRGKTHSPDPGAAAKMCLQALQLTRSWLQHLQRLGGAEAEQPIAQDLTSALLATCLLTLQHTPSADDGVEAVRKLQAVLVQLLPLLCSLCSRCGSNSAASLALLTLALRRQLSPSDWLPALQAHLDITALLQSAYQRLADERDMPTGKSETLEVANRKQVLEASASGTLQLILTMAQEVDGSAWLASARFFETLQCVGDWLLSEIGGGLGEQQPEMEQQPGNAIAAQQQWACLVSLQGLLLRSMAGRRLADQAAVSFAVMAHWRLMTALEPPGLDDSPTLTLASVQEAERSLFFLCGLTRLAGSWQMALLHGPAQARQAATDWLTFAAAPSTREDFRVSCAPVTQADKRLAEQAAELAIGEGWFGAFGSGSQGQESYESRGRGEQLPLLNAYSAEVAECLYGAAAHALSFLIASAYEISEAEAGTVDGSWPTPECLLGMQQQCIALSYDVSQPTMSGNAKGKRLCHTLMLVMQTSCILQDLLRQLRDPAHATQLADTQTRLRRASGKLRIAY